MESKWFVRSCSSISRLERWRVRHALESLHRSLTLLKELSVACPQINRSAKNARVKSNENVTERRGGQGDSAREPSRLDSEALKHYNRLWKLRNASPYATSRCSSVVEQRFCKPPMLGELSCNTTGEV